MFRLFGLRTFVVLILAGSPVACKTDSQKLTSVKIGLPDTIDFRSGKTPLMVAAIRNDMDLASRILDGGADPDTVDSSQMTALHHAVVNNSPVFFLLVERGARLDLADLEGETPLHAVIRFKRREMFGKLMEKPELATDVPNRHGVRPLAMSLMAREWDMARVLVERGADVNAANSGKVTPLMLAVNAGRTSQPETVRLLLGRGADLHARDQEGRTALFYAVGKAWVDITEMLLEAGADPQVQDRHGHQLPHYLTGEGLPEERARIREMLEKRGVLPSSDAPQQQLARIAENQAMMAVIP